MFTYPTIDVTLEVELPPSIEFFGPDEGETTSNGDRWYFRKKPTELLEVILKTVS
jgi:hypothetical protein